jgi:MoaA/NifB/PqqE/SkfB family radical SAM enzyme
MMNNRENFRLTFDRQIRSLFREVLLRSWRNPGRFFWLLRLQAAQNRAAKKRRFWQGQSIPVPPILIASVTRRCNLRCTGCYSLAREDKEQELSFKRWQEIFTEAAELGVSIVLLAGGEPLIRPEFLEIPSRFPQLLFLVFTNGILLDPERLHTLRRQKNLIPIISLEGLAPDTDSRRGPGVFARIDTITRQMKRQGLFYGLSVTLTRDNFDAATGEAFTDSVTGGGCRLLFYIEYTPVQPGTENSVLDPSQRAELPARLNEQSGRYGITSVIFPGDEEMYGGCLAASRGFVHLSASGRLEPCPFAPFSDSSVARDSLRQALQSRLLRTIRKNHHQLTESGGGCALWNHREWVRSLETGAAPE